jgi:hypothetical protein
VYVLLLVAVSGKLVECIRLIGKQGVLYGGSVADRLASVSEPTLGGSAWKGAR